ncbi:MAG: hypothetical protein ACD_51C00307G0002 [uncultured bacterium]|nr:MAG: hypothetical protein ACD_51C00307G0002 [uncultured bacterium]
MPFVSFARERFVFDSQGIEKFFRLAPALIFKKINLFNRLICVSYERYCDLAAEPRFEKIETLLIEISGNCLFEIRRIERIVFGKSCFC